MATRRKEITKELLDALRGADGDSPAKPADGSRRAGRDRNGGAAQPTRKAGRGPNGKPRAGSRRRGPRGRSNGEPETRSRGERAGRRAAAGGNGAAVFQDLRARARDLVQGLRETDSPGESHAEEPRGLEEAIRPPQTRTPRTRALREGDRGGAPPLRQPPTLPTPPGPPPPTGGRPRLKKLRIAAVLLGIGLLAMVSWFFGIMMSVAQDLPALENREQYKKAQNSIVTDRNGDKIATLTGNERRLLISSEEISPTIKQAVVAIEDQRFYGHRGIDFQGIGRAIVQDVMQRDAVQGGSTITQQFVKNALRAQQSRTIFQKLREAALAYHLERQWSKDKILSEYLNSIYFGEGAYGVESAAQTFFGWNHPGCGEDGNRCASQLLPEEAALLAGMVSSPTAYSPRTNPEAATDRRNQVLEKMAEQGVLPPEQYEQATESRVPKPSQIEPPDEDSQAPYFTTWLRQQVVDRYGAGEAFGGALEVQSTIDIEYQQAIEEIAYSKLAGIAPTTSIVVIDNKTGGVLAMVGGNDYKKEPFNLATNGHRQPGSAFKPFTLITALEAGRSPEEVFTSEPKTFDFKLPGYKQPETFEVNNYEDQYLGATSLAQATTYSDNSVYAELGLQVGTKPIAKTAKKLGVATKLSTNPAMTLGGLEEGVTPLEMAYAYSTLGRSGQRVGGTMDSLPGKPLGPLGIMKVTKNGDPVEDKTGASGENDVETEQVVDEASADTAVSLLESVVSSGTGRSAATGDFAWGKTGTTDDNGDAWFVGGTEDVTAAVWVGHADSNTPMETEFNGQPVDGGTYPALIWQDVVNAYESIIGSAEEEDRKRGKKGSDDESGYTEPAPAPPAPAPVPEETEPDTPSTPPQQNEPAPSTPAPPSGGGGGGGGGGGTGGGTGATGAARR